MKKLLIVSLLANSCLHAMDIAEREARELMFKLQYSHLSPLDQAKYFFLRECKSPENLQKIERSLEGDGADILRNSNLWKDGLEHYPLHAALTSSLPESVALVTLLVTKGADVERVCNGRRPLEEILEATYLSDADRKAKIEALMDGGVKLVANQALRDRCRNEWPDLLRFIEEKEQERVQKSARASEESAQNTQALPEDEKKAGQQQ